MDFQLSDEQLQLKKMVREFAEREIAPNVMNWDEPGEFPLETVQQPGQEHSSPFRIPSPRQALRIS